MQIDTQVNLMPLAFYDGPTFQMKLPDGWHQTPSQSVIVPFRHISRYSPQGNESVSVQVMTSVILLTEKSAQSFREVLSSQNHDLSAAELESISPVLGNAGDYNENDPRHSFDLHAARTGGLNGRMVLLVEGRWRFGENARFCGVFMAADESMRKVDRVYLECPGSVYIEMRQQFISALQSIQWR